MSLSQTETSASGRSYAMGACFTIASHFAAYCRKPGLFFASYIYLLQYHTATISFEKDQTQRLRNRKFEIIMLTVYIIYLNKEYKELLYDL